MFVQNVTTDSDVQYVNHTEVKQYQAAHAQMENMIQVLENVGLVQMNVKHVQIMMEFVLPALMTERMNLLNVHVKMVGI